MSDLRIRGRKHLEVCPQCGGYMKATGAIPDGPSSKEWGHESKMRSFGGRALKRFVCETCHHVETFQVDDLTGILEDET